MVRLSSERASGVGETMSIVTLSPATAAAIGHALNQDFYGAETPERMAWIVLLLRKLEDRAEWFPRGKWATIQEIECQLDVCAEKALPVSEKVHV